MAAAHTSHPELTDSHGHRLLLFAGRRSTVLGERIAAELGTRLGSLEVSDFANTETYVRFAENVRGADVFLVQSTCAPVNESLMELLLMIDAARLASAHRITAVLPWFGYCRQDKKSAPREPIAARLVAGLLETAGADRVLTMDLHTGQIQGFFGIPADHMTAMPMIAAHLAERAAAGEFDQAPLVVVAPDAGRAKLANSVAEQIGAELAVLIKQRPAHNQAQVAMLIGEVEGRTALLLDDMIDTAGTLVAGAQALREAGAARVVAAATHGLFSGPALARLGASPIEQVITTDTVPLPDGADADLIHTLSVSRLLAASIRNVFSGESVSELFGERNQVF